MGHTFNKFVLGIIAAVSMNSLLSVDKLASAQNDVLFGANVTNNNACFVIIRRNGTFVPNVTSTQLSSRLPGGQSGIADVFAFFPYDISVDTPPFFSSRPIGGDDNVTYSAWYSGQALNARGLNFPTQPGSVVVTPTAFFSFTRLTVDLEADRPDPFPAGNYTAEAIVRCE